jgi:hypothetical protein
VKFRNQQVAGSIPAGGSNIEMHARLRFTHFLNPRRGTNSDIQNGF